MSIETCFNFIRNVGSIRNEAIEKYGCNPSWVKITTITITSSFGKPLDIPFIREFFSNEKELAIRPVGSVHRFKWKSSDTTFYNQMSIYCDDHRSRKSVKLFPNGSIQVAGCSDVLDCDRVLKQISCIVSHITKRKMIATNYDIHMINSNFSLNQFVNLEEIFNVFVVNGHDATFNPDRYSAVKIKMQVPGKSRVTVSIFSSGRIIVTGAKALEQVSVAYQKILQIIYDSAESIVGEKSEKIEYFDRWRGSNIKDWLEKISSSTINSNV